MIETCDLSKQFNDFGLWMRDHFGQAGADPALLGQNGARQDHHRSVCEFAALDTHARLGARGRL